MKLHGDLGNKEIKEVVKSHPTIGEILERHDIGCIKCGVGTCLLNDVVGVHFLGDEVEAQIDKEIHAYLDQCEAAPHRAVG